MQPLDKTGEILAIQAKMLKMQSPERYIIINETNGVKTESTLLRLEDNKRWKIIEND